MAELFNTVFGRNLVAELKNIVHRPYLVVTMDDLWPRFSEHFDDGVAAVHFVRSLETAELERLPQELPPFECVVGLGGGQALDVAKYLAWRERTPLFQVPTSMSVNAAFGHRAAVRIDGVVRYIGWTVPEVVYVDYDVIRSAPALLNRTGVGDIFCYHTAHWDWQMARDLGRTEPAWPYSQALVDEATSNGLRPVLDALDDIHNVTDHGIEVLMNALRWGGGAFGNAGWNPRHIEGSEHAFFYALEYLTRRPYIHGQPVCLGILFMAALQDNDPQGIRDAMDRVGVPYRPEDMGITWTQALDAMRIVPEIIERAKLWYTVAAHRPITDEFVSKARDWIETGAIWTGSTAAGT